MKRMMAVPLAMMLMFMMALSGVLAQEDTGSDDDVISAETHNQARIMVSAPGAKVRMLQLEFSVRKSMVIGQNILDEISDYDESFDTSDLEIVLDELESIADEIMDVDTTGNSQEVVRQFVDLKSDAIDLARKFRNISNTAFDEEDIDAVRERVREGVQDDLSQMRERIRNAIREHNAERVENALRKMASSNQGLVDRVRSGSVTPQQAKSEISNALRSMNTDERRSALAAMAGNSSSDSARANAVLAQVRESFQERRETRLETRIQTINATSAARQAYLQDRLDSLKANTGAGTEDDTGGDE